MENTLELIKEKHRPKNDKWGDAWSHFDDVTFVDFIIAKLIRAHRAIESAATAEEKMQHLGDAEDSVEDGVMYALELKKRLRDDL